ncbi:hypothetical protein LTR84_003231 [Exophiala bonariae]|uniref:Uncharacterized protein n=1 Tax=Exophiala bonariae TaxID=1690606 RepID=A0AAV9N865_9EURO|nr:hypothetical protein LTR84_003231 [Exophiala bonariae]
MPANNENPDTEEGFTGIGATATDGPGTSAMNSFISSLQSEFTQTTRTNRGSSTTDASATTTDINGASTSAPGTTLSTVTTGAGNSATTSISGNASSTAGNAASNTSDGAVTVSENSCNSISCSSALKAAIAVPIVVAAIAAVLLFLFCARKRRKNKGAGASLSEKKPKKAGKKWSRHLRAFSFDAELLMGGRFSSSNSIRSRDPSVRSANNNSRNGAHSTEPSLHSIDEVAPPYRDAIAGSQPVNPSPLRHVNPAIAGAPDPIPRSVSSATAPPPYQPAGRDADHPTTPTSIRNPFADSTPVSPIDGSPFNDPPDGEEAAGAVRPTLSRGSSLYQSVNADDASDVASIGQAQVGRSVSVRQVGVDGSNSSR